MNSERRKGYLDASIEGGAIITWLYLLVMVLTSIDAADAIKSGYVFAATVCSGNALLFGALTILQIRMNNKLRRWLAEAENDRQIPASNPTQNLSR